MMDKTVAEQLRDKVQAFVDSAGEREPTKYSQADVAPTRPHWAVGLDDRQWGLIQNCRLYAANQPSGLPGHQLMLIVAVLAGRLEDADITPTEQEAGEVQRWLVATFGNLVDGDTLMEKIESVLCHYINQMGRWVELRKR